MSTFVYFTENCRSDAITHGIMEDVERLKQRIENVHSTSMFDPFPPPYLVKKKLGGRQGRLIAELRTVEDHAVIIFLAILIRGGRDYESFSNNPNNYGQQYFNHLVSDEEITKFVEESTRKPETSPKCEPSDGECGLLYGAFAIHKNSATEDLICETHRWVEQVTEERIKKQLVLLCNPCLEALGKAHGLHLVHVPSKPNWGIWVLRSEKRLLLITLVTDANADEAKRFAENITTQLEGKDTMTVLRISRRAYPAIVLADDNLWIDLESETVANMALSPEESEVLESARGTDNPFPLFINGRAGSGKSTILQYLFADLLYYFLNRPGEIQEPPLYLTANGELLRVARSFVERLLSSEATFNEDSTPSRNLVNGNREILDKAFREFQPHLLSLLPTEERFQHFVRETRVDYARFRRMWLDHFKRDNREIRKLGPDLSWHVIRSYIKGMSSETELEPDDYIHLPENQITVTHEAYKLVYEDVWLGWYQNILKEEELWDDQDLTRYILENDLAKPLYPVIFCDEAQDFTRLELELLLRLSLFSNRTLQPNDISRVPFAFAGDQFQTLNPTGFRWDSIKAAFVEKFIFELDMARRSGRTDLNYRELKYNYRSTRPIVRFGNHVQAMRAALFQLPDLKPQTPWAIETSSFPVVWFRTNDAKFWKKFRENQGFVVIIPCNEGEEADFVQDDPILREHVQIVDGVPQNVLSAGRAKGCEYPAVIVYGFGNATETDIVSRLELPLNKEQSLDPDRSLPLQYFINRLYVAVSRPKHRLVVVDTDEGFRKLWKCAQEQVSESSMLKNVKKGRDVWENEIEGMTLGNPEDLTRESISNPLENARAFEADGKARRDSFLLKQAAQAYRSASDEAKAKECRAYAFEADGKFLEAGDAFFDAGFAPEGMHCLWRAEKPGWLRLRDKIAQFPQIAQEIEYEFASIILGKIEPPKVTNLLDRFDKRLKSDNKFAESCIGENIWPVALNELLKPLNGQKQVSSWGQMANSLTHIRAKGVRVPPSACAWIFYSANRLQEAIGLWDEAGETKSNDYLKAKASVEPYPQRILSLSRLGLFEDIIQAWSDTPNSPLSPEQRTALADALREVNRLEDAFTYAWADGNASFADSMLRITIFAFNNGDIAMATKALHASVILLVRQAKWEMVDAFISSNEFIPSKEWKEKKIKTWVTSETEAMQVNLIRALARSDKLPNADTKFLQKLTKFFQDFLREKDKWRNKITILEAGSAMERAGRFVDAIIFYETYAKDTYKEEDIKQFARQRWSVCKKRQLDWEKIHSSSPQKLRGIEEELRQKMAVWQISLQVDLKPYPELEPITLRAEKSEEIEKSDSIVLPNENQPPTPTPPSSEAEELPEKTVIAVDDFEIELSRKLERCNIKHKISMETAFVKINERKFGGEVDFIQIDELHWCCEAWKINVSLQDITQGVLVINMKKLGVEIKLMLIPVDAG